MSLLARVDEDRDDDVAIATVDGEIDASNAADVAERLRRLVTNQSAALVVDLTRTTYIDSAGINLLFELADELRQRQLRLGVVVSPTSPIARMLSITGLDAAVTTHPTLAAALAAAR